MHGHKVLHTACEQREGEAVVCGAGTRAVSDNQEIHNYYDEISTRIKYKLSEYKGLSATWQQTQAAGSVVEEASAALSHAHEEVS